MNINHRLDDMTGPDPSGFSSDSRATVWPVLPDDPPKVGDFWLDARLTARASGVAYVGHDEAQTPVIVILLSQGAASDAAARDRLAGEVNQMHIDTVIARGGPGQDGGRLAKKFRPDRDDLGGSAAAPWVALAYDGSAAAAAEAGRVLASVELASAPVVGRPSGPAFQLHWADRTQPGLSRLWPLPWPGRHDRAGVLSILASWLLMLVIAALAVLIAILIFQRAPQVSPPPPVPPTSTPSHMSGSPPPSASPSPQSASPSPQSASPSPQSASPSPQSASPSPQSASPSPQSASPSGGAPSPSPDSRL